MKKLNKRQRQDYLKKCRACIEQAKQFRKREGLDDLWKRMVDLYRGKQFPPNVPYDDLVVINHAFAIINVIVPSVAVNWPKTVVRARKPEDYDRATITEAVVNYWWKRFEVLPEFQEAVKESLICGHGWLKVGWRFVEEEVFDQALYDEEFNRRKAEVDAYAMENPDMAAELPTDEQLAEDIVATRLVTRQDQPFVERVSIHDIYVDPEATSLRDAKWIAQKLVKTYSEVMKNPAYKKSALRSVRPDSGIGDPDDWRDNDRPDARERQRVTVYEYYDLQAGQMCVFSEIGDDLLVDPVPQPYEFGHPFIEIVDYKVPNQFYGMGELEVLEPIQMELNLTRTAMFNDRKQFRRKWLYDPKAFDDAGRNALQSDDDNVLVPVNANVPLDQAIIPMPGQTPNPELYQQSEIIVGDITHVTGVNEYQRGALSEIRRTATEASIIQDAANARAADKLARVEKIMSLVSRRLIQLAQQYLDAPQIARIVGSNGLDLWFQFEPDDINGEFDFEVEAGSTQPYNEAQRRKTALDMLAALAPFGDPNLGLVDMREVIAFALEYGFDIKDPNRFLMNRLPPGLEAAMGPEDAAALLQESQEPPPPLAEQLGMREVPVEEAGLLPEDLGQPPTLVPRLPAPPTP